MDGARTNGILLKRGKGKGVLAQRRVEKSQQRARSLNLTLIFTREREKGEKKEEEDQLDLATFSSPWFFSTRS